jgi:hypothetical protein
MECFIHGHIRSVRDAYLTVAVERVRLESSFLAKQGIQSWWYPTRWQLKYHLLPLRELTWESCFSPDRVFTYGSICYIGLVPADMYHRDRMSAVILCTSHLRKDHRIFVNRETRTVHHWPPNILWISARRPVLTWSLFPFFSPNAKRINFLLSC